MNASPERLPSAALDARLHAVQKQAFALYEDAAQRAERDHDAGDRAYAEAERAAAPLIAEAKALNDERVRRLRARARIWWIATMAVAVAGAIAAWWMAAGRR